MKNHSLQIITITKDDIKGVVSTINSTRFYREKLILTQLVIDSSDLQNAKTLKNITDNEIGLHYHWIEPNGISNAFNYGIKQSTSQWLWFLNGGDMLINSTLVENFLKTVLFSNADLVIGQIQYETSKVVRQFPPLFLQWPSLSAWIPHPSLIIKKECFLKYGFYKTNLKATMDYDYWLMLLNKDIKTDLISIPIVTFNEDGMSSVNKRVVARECLSSLIKHTPSLIKTKLVRTKLLITDILILIKRAYF